jgi:DNA ligase-1
MQTTFLSLVKLCEKFEATKKRNFMIELASNFLKELSVEEVEPAVCMILGRAFPKWDQRTLDVSWVTLSNLIKRLANANWKIFMDAFSQTGDVGNAVKMFFEVSKVRKQVTLFEKPLTILEVRRTFEAIAEANGVGSRERKERLIEILFSSATPLEAKYLTKILIGEMRTGFYEGLMEAAVSRAFNVPLEMVEKAVMIMGDVAEVAVLARKSGSEGVSNIHLSPFKPIKPMLAQMAGNVEEVLNEFSEPVAFEYKLDGARVQIHKSGSKVRIFSRRLTDVTESLPEIVDLVVKEVKANEVILEGEVIAVGKDGCSPLPFQYLMRRFKRIHELEETKRKIPIRLYLFDIVFLNGQNLFNMPYWERREKLKEIAGKIPLTTQLVTNKIEYAKNFLEEALNAGHEGLIAKKIDSAYTPGIRGRKWFKIKKTLEPLDLVIVGAEYGYGRRHGWLSDYYLAARNDETGEFEILGKTFKGLTDEEIKEMTIRLKQLTIKEERRLVWVIPKIVVTVAYNEIQESPKYNCGLTLRFARITKIRDEKTPEEADTIQKIREIYNKQFEKKARLQSPLNS